MKNTFGQSVALTLFGESHGEAVGAVIDGLTPGIPVCDEKIALALSRRRPAGVETPRRESDEFQLVSGVFNGKTTGTPLCILIPNRDVKSDGYAYGQARPSHADYAAYCKYHGYEDYRGGGHFSGRVTAAAVAAGAIFAEALSLLNIETGTHILRCGGETDRAFMDTRADIAALKTALFPTLSAESGEKISSVIKAAGEAGDSVGGVTQTAVVGMPAGVGEPWFDTLEGQISHALFSVGGIKGIEFGGGFASVTQRGSVFNDPLRMKNGRVISTQNNNGGINGGISNGMPIVFQCAVKPTPSIHTIQKSVDFVKGEDIDLSVSGRHDPSILRRICPVIDAMTALVLCDVLAGRFGTDVFLKGVD